MAKSAVEMDSREAGNGSLGWIFQKCMLEKSLGALVMK